jgi:hypothetical protein
MKSFIIPGILWSYTLSLVLAVPFWAAVYNKLLVTLDLSPSQGWLLPIGFNILVACIGIPQIVTFVVSLRRRDAITTSRHIASSLSIAAVALSIIASARGVVGAREHLAVAASELIGRHGTELFDAGQIVDGTYSNRIVGVVMELPKNWHPMTLNSIRRAKYEGAYAVARDDTRRAEELARERSGSYILLDVCRYPNACTGYNPSLTLVAYDKQALAAAGIGTLEAFVSGFAAMGEPYHVRSGPSRERFGAETGYHVHVEGRFPLVTIQQHVYATETESFYIVATASVIDEDNLVAMQHAIATLRLVKKTTTE